MSIFFLLSGFVLGESLRRDEAPFIKKSIKFYIKRIFRIYPIFVLQLLLLSVFLLYVPSKHFPAASSWYEYWFRFPLTLKEVVSNLLFQSTSLGGVTWTLKAEIIGSIFIPFFFFIVQRTHKYLDITLVILLIAVSYLLHVSRETSFLYVFYIGLSLPKWKDNFQTIALKKEWTDILLLGIFVGTLIITATPVDVRYPFIRHLPLTLFLGVLIYVPTKFVSKVLTSKVFQFLGKVSYSFYLFHFLVLYVLVRFLLQYVDNQVLHSNFLLFEFGIALVSLSVTAGLSHFLYLYVEAPCISFGRKVAKLL